MDIKDGRVLVMKGSCVLVSSQVVVICRRPHERARHPLAGIGFYGQKISAGAPISNGAQPARIAFRSMEGLGDIGASAWLHGCTVKPKGTQAMDTQST